VAVAILAHLGNPAATSALLAAAEAPGPVDLRARAVAAAGLLAGPALLPRFVSLAEGDEPALRPVATWAIGRVGGAGAAPPLRRLLDSDDPEVRAFAAVALAVLGDRRAAPALRRMLAPAAGALAQRAAAWA